MKASIIKIGNSKGIRIPKSVLEQVGLDASANLEVKDGTLVITPIRRADSEYSEELLMSLPALSDWNKPEEDDAWASLQ